MNLNYSPLTLPIFARIAAVAAAAMSCAYAVDDDLRIVPQVVAGTSGVEPGLALEWRASDLTPLIIRPEVLISEDGRPGGGAAVLWDISTTIDLRGRQAFAVGPRAVYHNSDESGWEIDAMATWTYDLVGGVRPWRHALGVLGAVGVLRDKENDENEVGASAGIFYSYRF